MMSAEPGQPSGGEPAGSDGRRFSTLIGSLTGTAKAGRTAQAHQAAQASQADQAYVPEAVPARPTFTARPGGPSAVAPSESADAPAPGSPGSNVRRTPADVPAQTADSPSLAAPAPVMPPPAAPALPDQGGARGQGETRALPRPAAVPDASPDEPLLGDAAGLRARWQRAQAGFVDDPREAVGDAADLIEQTAQALVGALRQRQRQLRVMWERGPGAADPGDGAPAAGAADTEHLRLMMQRYRALFNQLCP